MPKHRTMPETWNARLATLGLLIMVAALILYLVSSSSQHHPTPVAQASTSQAITSAVPTLSHSSSPMSSPSIATPSTAAVPTTPVMRQTTYVVKPGDNLTTIAAWFHTPLEVFYQWNLTTVGPDWNLIHPGQTLTITLGPQ